ncbi:hypothetical protein [Actinocorallia sp. A-T 12471]|nr:hypothetical protein [Actinocorallia sp. A-T 12471]MDX6739201.1 hypothetical protein [Actinocorallia sp. A-T 12471]
MTGPIDLTNPHLVGADGLGMAPLAELLRGAEAIVTGSDPPPAATAPRT